jgi:hypothetical protein
LWQAFVDAAGNKADDGKMIDHQPFLLGGKQIARWQRLRWCFWGSGRIDVCYLRRCLIERGEVFFGCSTPPGTPGNFAYFVHITIQPVGELRIGNDLGTVNPC